MPKIVDRTVFLDAVLKTLGDVDEIKRPDVARVCSANGVDWPHWLTNDVTVRIDYGTYSLVEAKKNRAKQRKPSAPKDVPVPRTPEDDEAEFSGDGNLAIAAMAPAANLKVVSSNDEPAPALVTKSLIPEIVKGYVPFGHWSDVRSIIKSKRFYPMYITGLSGNGKTMMIEQVCAVEKRECIRVNITIETDEDDLLGGFRLEDGHTVWQDGPVITAMERGAVLLLDEVDLGSNKMMCLQPVLEGKGVFLKKTNRLVKPAHGFQIVATANTKGKGSDDGKFIGTNVMNEAFLERFSITLEQEYPATRIEAKILANIFDQGGASDIDFVDKLVNWAEIVRKSYEQGAIDEIISTRRLVHIANAYLIFIKDPKPREKAIQLCLNRFDADTKVSFMELYKKVDEKASASAKGATVTKKSQLDEDTAF